MDGIVRKAREGVSTVARLPVHAGTVVKNLGRRNLVKLGFFGGAAFVLGKIFGPSLSFFGSDAVVGEKDFENFRVVETKKELRLFNRGGDEIVIVEKE